MKAQCAKLMSESEPWITLRRQYSECLKIVCDPQREVHGIFNNRKELLGFVIITLHGAFKGYIQSIAVDPLFRGQGLGCRLLSFAEQKIFEHAPNVFVCVSSFNTNALRLYNRVGYKIVGELENYIVAGHSEILLRKTICPISEFVQKADYLGKSF